jgi:molybdopterin-containing oxidoreductase family membrane subunit
MKRIVYREWRLAPQRYWGLLALLAVIAGMGGLAFWYMEHQGHWVTGMTNEIVWGTPHLFAIFLIVAASGALNIASIGTVFGKSTYQPLGRFSGLLAVALLVGGLLVLVLDLGRPDRLIVAMTSYNFRSIFAWNVILYSGFVVIVVAYLVTMVDRRLKGYYKAAGTLAFVWRLMLTTGTGSIFGFIVARQAFDTALLAPMFIVMSFLYGLAIFILVLMFAFAQDQRPLGPFILTRFKGLMAIFIAAVLLFVMIYFLTKIYGAKNYDLVNFYLVSGGRYTIAFWFGWMIIGLLAPFGIVTHPVLSQDPKWIAGASALVILGGMASIYFIVIGGQAFPMAIFPDQTILESGFHDGVGGQIAPYAPSLPEFLLGLGGVAVALIITAVGVRVLQFLPESLADKDADPHATVKA